ncbi:MAG: hypothetical protein CSA33_08675 [Desulfobulbus propionicus]|nr:MAG: hypothetical protein CSA33_08675 [Desulfobulbus propionicus]
MIVYELACTCGCQFEGWFSDRSSFEKQLSRSLITCPECHGRQVHKILSPVAFHAHSSSVSDPVHAPTAKAEDVFRQEVVRYLASVGRFVEEHFEDVGTKLAVETLKMHYGVEEKRNICGVATEQEEEMLEQEGIQLLKVPYVKPDPKSN